MLKVNVPEEQLVEEVSSPEISIVFPLEHEPTMVIEEALEISGEVGDEITGVSGKLASFTQVMVVGLESDLLGAFCLMEKVNDPSD